MILRLDLRTGYHPVGFIPYLATSFRHIQILHFTNPAGHSKVQRDPLIVFLNLHDEPLWERGGSNWSVRMELPSLRSFALYTHRASTNMESFASDLRVLYVGGSQNNRTEE